MVRGILQGVQAVVVEVVVEGEMIEERNIRKTCGYSSAGPSLHAGSTQLR